MDANGVPVPPGGPSNSTCADLAYNRDTHVLTITTTDNNGVVCTNDVTLSTFCATPTFNNATRTLTVELSPPRLYTLGFVPALNWLAEQMSEEHDIQCDFQDDGKPKPMATEVQVLLYRIVRELLYNVVKHAAARRSKVSISLVDETIRVCVDDDGVGFDPAKLKQDSHKDGFGLFKTTQVRQNINSALPLQQTERQTHKYHRQTRSQQYLSLHPQPPQLPAQPGYHPNRQQNCQPSDLHYRSPD